MLIFTPLQKLTKQMGNYCQLKQSRINIATLNFSGINTNPFQYQDGSDMFLQLNSNVQYFIHTEIPGFDGWKIGKLDKVFITSLRLSVGFSSKLDTVQNTLLYRQEFSSKWKTRFIGWLALTNNQLKYTDDEVNACIAMDFVFYRAVIKYVYKISSFEEMQQNYKSYPADVLNDFLAKVHSRPASQLTVKEDLLVRYILMNKIDVLCLQEAEFINWKEDHLKGYSIHKNHDSVILYKRTLFGTVNTSLMERYGSQLDFNKDTAFIFTDKGYLILSVHLSSKSQIHHQQAQKMFTVLRKIKKSQSSIGIGIGMDANHFIDKNASNFLDQNGKLIFFISPSTKDRPTTVKQRSFLQAQFSKAGKQVSEVKDHILTTNKIQSSQIENVMMVKNTKRFLPNDDHPYDHYLVRAVINFE